jgi:hypothetical protein
MWVKVSDQSDEIYVYRPWFANVFDEIVDEDHDLFSGDKVTRLEQVCNQDSVLKLFFPLSWSGL